MLLKRCCLLVDSLGELPEAGPLPEPSDSKLFLV